MKKKENLTRLAVLVVFVVALGAAPVVAEAQYDSLVRQHNSLVQVYPLGPLVGLYTASFEQVLDDQLSLVLLPAYHNPQFALFRDLADELYGVKGLNHDDYDAWRLSFDAGLNWFPEGGAPKGFFLGGALAVGYLTVSDQRESPAETDSSVLLGASLHLGYRWILDMVSIAPRASLGYLFGLDQFEDSIGEKKLQDYGRGLDWDLGVELAIAF